MLTNPRLNRMLVCLLVAAALIVPPPYAAWAQQQSVPREHHAWARFQPGAWKKVRVTTETLNAEGEVTSQSSTDTTTLLEGVADDCYSLQVEVRAEVAGKRFEAEPQFVARGYCGEAEGQSAMFRNVSTATAVIEGKRIPCKVYEYQIDSETSKRTTKVYYSDQFAPYVLRKQTVATDTSGNMVLYETVEEVVAVQMPCKVKGEIVSSWHVNTTTHTPKGTTVTKAIHCAEVPGEVIAHTSKELDAAGRTLRRSTLELVDYGLEIDRRIMHRRQWKRAIKGRRTP